MTRLLSGPLVNYRTQTSRKLSRVQLDKFKFQSASGLNFKKANYNPFEQLSTAIMANQMRAERYQDFEQMEYTPEIASAMDIYADEMTTSSDLSPLKAFMSGIRVGITPHLSLTSLMVYKVSFLRPLPAAITCTLSVTHWWRSPSPL